MIVEVFMISEDIRWSGKAIIQSLGNLVICFYFQEVWSKISLRKPPKVAEVSEAFSHRPVLQVLALFDLSAV
jgi:hypothetical protein